MKKIETEGIDLPEQVIEQARIANIKIGEMEMLSAKSGKPISSSQYVFTLAELATLLEISQDQAFNLTKPRIDEKTGERNADCIWPSVIFNDSVPVQRIQTVVKNSDDGNWPRAKEITVFNGEITGLCDVDAYRGLQWNDLNQAVVEMLWQGEHYYTPQFPPRIDKCELVFTYENIKHYLESTRSLRKIKLLEEEVSQRETLLQSVDTESAKFMDSQNHFKDTEQIKPVVQNLYDYNEYGFIRLFQCLGSSSCDPKILPGFLIKSDGIWLDVLSEDDIEHSHPNELAALYSPFESYDTSKPVLPLPCTGNALKHFLEVTGFYTGEEDIVVSEESAPAELTEIFSGVPYSISDVARELDIDCYDVEEHIIKGRLQSVIKLFNEWYHIRHYGKIAWNINFSPMTAGLKPDDAGLRLIKNGIVEQVVPLRFILNDATFPINKNDIMITSESMEALRVSILARQQAVEQMEESPAVSEAARELKKKQTEEIDAKIDEICRTIRAAAEQHLIKRGNERIIHHARFVDEAGLTATGKDRTRALSLVKEYITGDEAGLKFHGFKPANIPVQRNRSYFLTEKEGYKFKNR